MEKSATKKLKTIRVRVVIYVLLCMVFYDPWFTIAFNVNTDHSNIARLASLIKSITKYILFEAKMSVSIRYISPITT